MTNRANKIFRKLQRDKRGHNVADMVTLCEGFGCEVEPKSYNHIAYHKDDPLNETVPFPLSGEVWKGQASNIFKLVKRMKEIAEGDGK